MSGRGADPSCATVTGTTPAGYGLTSADPYGSGGTFPGFLENDWSGTAFTAALTRGDHRFQSITSGDSIDYRRYQDFDDTPAEHLHLDYNTQIDAWSQEFRVFHDGSGNLGWLLGMSYAEDELTEATLLYGAQGVLPLLFSGATWSPQDYVQDTEAWALYGHADWRVAEQLNVVGELRYTDESKASSAARASDSRTA